MYEERKKEGVREKIQKLKEWGTVKKLHVNNAHSHPDEIITSWLQR